MSSKIQQMIEELCPEGVEYKKLGEVCKVLRGKRLTKKQLSDDGTYPVYHGGLSPIGFYNEHNRLANSAMIIDVGASAGTVGYCDKEFWSSDGCFTFSHEENINQRYLYYFLQSIELSIKGKVRTAGIPTLDNKDVERIQIPLPHLAIQEEIVRILDKFSLLEAELEAELDCRKRQYEYYRDRLIVGEATPAIAGSSLPRKNNDIPSNASNNPLNHNSAQRSEVKWMKMSDVGTFVRGNGLQKKDFTEEGIGCIHYGQLYTHYGTSATTTKTFCSEELAKKLKKAHKGDLVIATTSENTEDVCKAVAWLGEEEIAVSGDAYIFKHNQNPKYMAYLFQTELFYSYKRRVATGTKVIRVSGDQMGKFLIPVPPLAEQERIANILDRFEALTTDISEGLPAEIAARRKQYEYYRDKLLTFERKAS